MTADVALAAPVLLAVAVLGWAGARYVGRAFAALVVLLLTVAATAGFAFAAIGLS
jgi:hypothetical protein